ncbi:hypothetical protein QYE76_027001 [Lolium multiflorum]|uniref:Retrotransposon gag domain-containing protein n=1 Tax=Lolium multiflorum TaxID=4521 RepID=A0AAD8Q1W3_LOLMU|nr:hypothetical protein QYE76_027001 [Lolium multiflorum]
MKKAAELLKKKDEEIDINYVRKLVASAMQQQSKADTSRRLASNPEQCISTAQKDAIPSQHRDDESRTGSTERRRKVRDHPNPISCLLDSTPKNCQRERIRCILAETSTVFHHRHPELRVLRYLLDVAVPPETPGPMGQVESTSATTCRLLETGAGSVRRNHAEAGIKTASLSLVGIKNATLSLAEAKDAIRNQGGAGTRSTHLSHAGAGTTEATTTKVKGATGRSQPREPRRESEGGRSSYRPPRRSPSPPPSGGGGGGGGRGRRSRSRSKSPSAAPRARDRLNEYRSDYIGPRCFGQMIREEPKPRSLNLKLPGNLKHYDGSERPDTWIEDYYNAVTFAGGTPNIACRMLQLYLIGPARVWLSDLEENTIFCWLDLKKAFENHFRGTYKRPATTSDLQACIQKKGETSRVSHLMVGGGRGRGRGGGAGRGQQRADEVTAAGSRAPQTYEEYRDMPCLAHLDPATGKSTHTNRNCKWVNDLKNDPEAGYKRARKHRPRGKGGKGKNKDKEEDSSEAMDEDDASPEPKEGTAANKSNPFGRKSVGTYHTFLGTPTVRAKKSALRILNATVPAVPQYVKWSEKACTFDRSDHPAVIPKECYALVVSPRIDGQTQHSLEFSWCGSREEGKLSQQYQISAFGNVNNYREEMITFEVVPFKSSYHVIFGRPTYHKFHARACYIYNKLKIPGPNGWITVSGDYKKARDCEEGEAAFAESVISGEELQGYRAAVDPTEMQTTKKQISEQKTSFKAAIETKKHDLVEGDNSKQVSVGANMDPK